MANISGSPYWDRYDGDSAHKRAGYTRVLAVPGRAEQAAEFNEAQSIQRDYLERLGNAMFKDGTIISGCEMNVQGHNLTVSAGKVFLSGLIRDVPETVLYLAREGTERVVATVNTEIVTANQDSTLRDPAIGAENYNLEGADREKQTVTLSIVAGDSVSANGSVLGGTTPGDGSPGGDGTGSGTNPSGTNPVTSTTIYTFVDGSVPNEATEVNQYAYVTDILAERTYDENGNYKVNGLDLQPVTELEDDGKIKVYISAGRAYIRGYQVTKNTMSDIRLNRSTTTRFVQSESHYYNSSMDIYRLSNGPIDSITNLTALVTVSSERHYRGNIRGGQDALNHTPVDSITRVWSVDDAGVETVYRQGIDYVLFADQVDWSRKGEDTKEPEPGTTYFVTYVYNSPLTRNIDFRIYNQDGDAYLQFIQGGRKPDQNTRMYVSYYYTLARRDLILLDSNGSYSVLEGQPDKFEDLLTPYNGSDAFLALGYVNVFAKPSFGDDDPDRIAQVVNYEETRLTQDNFITMLKRIDALEDRIADLDLEREIEAGEDPSSLRGYFTDVFDSINKSDLGYVDANEQIRYTACIDFDKKELTTPTEPKSFDLGVNNSSSDKYEIMGTVISAPYTLQLALQQKYATGTMLVNPYASYGPLCKVELNPSVDNWTEEKTIRVNNTLENKAYTTSTQTYSRWVANSHARGTFEGSSSSTSTSFTGTTSSTTSSSSVAKTITEYMRVRDVAVTGSAFGANAKNIRCVFNGKPVDLVATGSTAQGNLYASGGKNYKTVNANAIGYFTGKFTIPANTPCGKANVQLITYDADEKQDKSGSAIYSAVGTLLTTTITNTTTVTSHYQVLTTITNTYSSDPLAQSFMLSETHDRNLMKIGIYFAKKSNTRPAVLQVRNMVNGYPGETVYAEVKIDPDQIKLPTNPNVPVVTEITLNQPVYCKAGVMYCFVVLSDSNEYALYYANMGENLLGTTQQMVINPYNTGVMFSSSNAMTWTAHQGADLKFELYRSVYTGNGTIVFNEVNSSDITGIMLDATYEVGGDETVPVLERSGLTWFYRYALTSANNTFSEWLPIDTLVYRDLNTITTRIDLKAVINTDFSTSPFIASDRVTLRSFTDAASAVYISKHLMDTEFDEEYQRLKISYQACMPNGASYRAYYMDNENGPWVELVEDGKNVELSTSRVDEEFTQFTWLVNKLDFIKKNPTMPGSKFFKFRFDLETNVRYNRPRIKKLAVIFRYDM